MDIRVFDRSEESELIRLALRQESGGVVLVAVDKDGKELVFGRIAIIQSDGCLLLCEGLSDKFGLQVESRNETIRLA